MLLLTSIRLLRYATFARYYYEINTINYSIAWLSYMMSSLQKEPVLSYNLGLTWSIYKPYQMASCTNVISGLQTHNIFFFIICPIAIAYSMGQIIKSFCVCPCVCVSVCGHSHGRISSSIFTKLDIDVKTPKSKNEFVGGQYRPTTSSIFPLKTPNFGA